MFDMMMHDIIYIKTRDVMLLCHPDFGGMGKPLGSHCCTMDARAGFCCSTCTIFLGSCSSACTHHVRGSSTHMQADDIYVPSMLQLHRPYSGVAVQGTVCPPFSVPVGVAGALSCFQMNSLQEALGGARARTPWVTLCTYSSTAQDTRAHAHPRQAALGTCPW